MTNAVINTDLKKYTKKYVIEENTLWEVFDDNISKAEVIWDMENIAELFNKLVKENEELEQAYTQLRHRHSLLHDVCIDAECERDSYHKDIASLEKENEQLKKEVQWWKYRCGENIQGDVE